MSNRVAWPISRRDDLVTKAKVGDFGEACVHSDSTGQDTNPTSEPSERLNSQKCSEAQEIKRDPQGEEYPPKRVRQPERADPEIHRERAPQQQRYADRAIGILEREHASVIEYEHECEPPPECSVTEKRRHAKGIAKSEFEQPGQDLDGAAVGQRQWNYHILARVWEHACVDEAQQDGGHPESGQPQRRRVGELGAFCHLVTPTIGSRAMALILRSQRAASSKSLVF